MLMILGCALIFLFRAIRGKEPVEVAIAVGALVLWALNLLGILVVRGNPVGW